MQCAGSHASQSQDTDSTVAEDASPAKGAQPRAPMCTKAQRDCLHVLYKIYADRSLGPRNAVVLSLSSVGWRRFARDLLQVGAGHPLLPLQQTCEIYQSVAADGERPPVQHKTEATWRVGGICRPVSTERPADFETFVSAVHAVACRWQPANPNPLAAMLHAVGHCSFRRPELESKLAARQRATGYRDAQIVSLRLWDLLLPDETEPTLLDPLCTTSRRPTATPPAARRASAPSPALPVTPSTAPPSRAAPKTAAAKPRVCRGRTSSCASLLLNAPSPPLPSPLPSGGGARTTKARGLIRRASVASAEWMDVEGTTTTTEGSACSGPAMDSAEGGTAGQWVQQLYELFSTRAKTIERAEGLSWHGFELLALQCRLNDLFSVRQLRGAFEASACVPPPAGASRLAKRAPPLQLQDSAQLGCCLRRVASLRSSRFEQLLHGLAVSLPPERRGAWQSAPLRLRALQLHIARATSTADTARLQLCMREGAQPNGPAVSSGGGWRSRYACLRGTCVLTLPASLRTTLITAQLSRRRKLARGGLDIFALLHPPQPPSLLPAPTLDEPPDAAKALTKATSDVARTQRC